jgi:DNA-directed RNA polymerase specialized sigma24 family protein
MQLDAPNTRRSLERMVARLTPQRLWHEDLVQEALIHLWLEEQRCPGRSPCWYLRSCQFYLRNRLRQGRSLDSPKRRNGSALIFDSESGLEQLLAALPESAVERSACEIVMARDLLAALLPALTPTEREILACLLEGLGTRETAQRLRLSHTCVSNKRRRIAALTCKLEPGLQPPNGF